MVSVFFSFCVFLGDGCSEFCSQKWGGKLGTTPTLVGNVDSPVPTTHSYSPLPPQKIRSANPRSTRMPAAYLYAGYGAYRRDRRVVVRRRALWARTRAQRARP